MVEEFQVTARFNAARGDWTTLSRTGRVTIEALYQHPLSHNLEWSSVVSLFEKLGTVDHKGHNEIAFGVGGEHRRVHKPHGKDLTATEVLAFRHMLTRAGWAPPGATLGTDTGTVGESAAAMPEVGDLMVVVDHHEARLSQLDVRFADVAGQVIKAVDPEHLLNHHAHNDQAREQRQRTPEGHAFYERIAHAISTARAIVVIGHGTGRSNAANQLVAFLHQHHPDTARKVVCEAVADLPSLTSPQLRDLGRRALTAGTPGSTTGRPI